MSPFTGNRVTLTSGSGMWLMGKDPWSDPLLTAGKYKGSRDQSYPHRDLADPYPELRRGANNGEGPRLPPLANGVSCTRGAGTAGTVSFASLTAAPHRGLGATLRVRKWLRTHPLIDHLIRPGQRHLTSPPTTTKKRNPRRRPLSFTFCLDTLTRTIIARFIYIGSLF